MNVLHLLVSGGTGGIEILMRNYAQDSAHNNTFIFVWKSGEIAERMKQNGASVYVTNAGSDGLYTTLKKIRQICREEKIDVAVSHNSAPLLKIALLYIKMTLPGIRVVTYAHANARDICEYKRKKGLPLRKFVHKLGFAAADSIVAISDSVKVSLQEYLGVKEKKILRIYNGTPVESTNCRGCNRTTAAPLKLIYVGRLIPEKGIQNTLQVLSKLRNRVPFLFTVVGDGSYRETLETLTKHLGLEDWVRFRGNRNDVPEQLAQADVFVHLPEWDEGFGITVIEALAAGCVCVVNQRGALPEIIDNGKNGYVVPTDDPAETLKILETIWKMSEEEWQQVQRAALERAQAFSMETFVQELDNHLSEICS